MKYSRDGKQDERYEFTTYNLGYRIMPNGDIITSDGKPRDVDRLQLQLVAEKAVKEGRAIAFRFVKADVS